MMLAWLGFFTRVMQPSQNNNTIYRGCTRPLYSEAVAVVIIARSKPAANSRWI